MYDRGGNDAVRTKFKFRRQRGTLHLRVPVSLKDIIWEPSWQSRYYRVHVIVVKSGGGPRITLYYRGVVSSSSVIHKLRGKHCPPIRVTGISWQEQFCRRPNPSLVKCQASGTLTACSLTLISNFITTLFHYFPSFDIVSIRSICKGKLCNFAHLQ